MENKTTKKIPDLIVIALAFLNRLLLFFCLDVKYFRDSCEYIARDGFAWMSGKVDRYRLPLYPMLIDIFKAVFGEYFDAALCFCVLLVSLLSIFVFYLTLRKLTDKKWIYLLVTYSYGTFNAVAGWDKEMMTESLSLSLTVFVLYGIVLYLEKHKIRSVVFTSAVLILGCFLRAVFVIYAGLFFGAVLLTSFFPSSVKKPAVSKEEIKSILIKSLTAFIPVVLVLLYAGAFYRQYGSFTLSDSYLGQQLVIVLENGYYEDSSDKELKSVAYKIINANLQDESVDDEDILDPEIEAKIKDLVYEQLGFEYDISNIPRPSWARFYILHTYSNDRVKAFVKESLGNHKSSNMLRLIPNMFEYYSTTQYRKVRSTDSAQILMLFLDDAQSLFSLNIFHTIIVSLIELIVFVSVLIRKKTILWLRIGLGACILSTIYLSLHGTNFEYARTAITVLPFVFAAFSLYLDRFAKTLENISRKRSGSEQAQK